MVNRLSRKRQKEVSCIKRRVYMAIRMSGLDLTRIPFGGANCGILVYEENNSDGTNIKTGLYLAARIQGGEHRREGGIVDIVPTINGEPVTYTYCATPTKLTLTAEGGELNIIVDTDSTARIFGSGLGIRLYSKFPFYSMMNASILPGDLLDLNLGGTQMNGGRYFMKPLKGKPACNSVFNPSTNGPDDAEVELIPDENGELDFEVYMMNPDEWGYIEYSTAKEALANVEKRFGDFMAMYPNFPVKYSDLMDYAVYSVYLHREKPNENDIYPTMNACMVYAGRLSHGWANAYEQPLHAMALSDTSEELKLINNMYVHMSKGMLPGIISTTKVYFKASPPTQGLAVLDILEKLDGKLDTSEAAKLYCFMKENYQWWKKSHSFGENRFSYNHRDELCLKGASYNAMSFPLESPDLYALMILYVRAIGRLAIIAGESSSEWEETEKGLMDTLRGLWNGESFDCRSVISGMRYKTDSLLARIPVLLGNELGEDILDRLSADLESNFLSPVGFTSESKKSAMYTPSVEGRGAVVAWLQQLIISGLFYSGKTELGRRAAEKILDCAERGEIASVVAPECEAIVYRPGDAVNGITGSMLIYIANLLN